MSLVLSDSYISVANIGLNEMKDDFTICKNLLLLQATHLEKSSQKIFRCELCAQTFLARASLRQHIHAVHENRRNHPCSFCGKRFSTSTNIRYHVEAFHSANKEKVHSCDKCEYRSHSKENLAQHVRRHNHANRREFYFCRKQFVNFSKLVTHCRHHTLEF